MKFTLNLDQRTWEEVVPEANLTHMAIFDVIQSVCSSQSEKIQRVNGYTWISNSLIINELPKLKIKTKGAITPYLKDLKEYGLIDTLQGADSKVYYRLTSKADSLTRDYLENEEIPFKILNGGVQNFKQGCSKNQTDHNTIYPNTKDQLFNKEKNLKRSYSKKKQAIETLPENDYTAKVNSFFANPDFRKKITEKIPVWKEMGVPNVKQNLLMAKEWLLNNTTPDKQRGEANGSFMRFLNQWMINAAGNSKKTIIHEMKSYEKSKPNNAPSYSYTDEQIAEIESQFNQSLKG